MAIANSADVIWAGQATQREIAGFYNQLLAQRMRSYTKGDCFIEIGIGIGNIAAGIMPDARRYIGIDNVPSHIEAAQQRFERHIFSGHVADISDPTQLDFLAQNSFDSVISANCFEHIDDDASALRNIVRLARPGTRFVILVPAHQALFCRFDEEAGHYRRYNSESLQRLLSDAGLKVVKTEYVNTVGAVAWFLIGKLASLYRPHEAAKIAAPEGMSLPWKIMYAMLGLFRYPVSLLLRSEAAVSVPFGLSIIGVGEK